MLMSVLCSVLQDVMNAIEMHTQRDLKEYTGLLASTRASLRKTRHSVRYRNHDKEEAVGLKKRVDDFVEQFQVCRRMSECTCKSNVQQGIHADRELAHVGESSS